MIGWQFQIPRTSKFLLQSIDLCQQKGWLRSPTIMSLVNTLCLKSSHQFAEFSSLSRLCFSFCWHAITFSALCGFAFSSFYCNNAWISLPVTYILWMSILFPEANFWNLLELRLASLFYANRFMCFCIKIMRFVKRRAGCWKYEKRFHFLRTSSNWSPQNRGLKQVRSPHATWAGNGPVAMHSLNFSVFSSVHSAQTEHSWWCNLWTCWCSGASHYMRRGSQRHNIPGGVKTIGSFLWPNS